MVYWYTSTIYKELYQCDGDDGCLRIFIYFISYISSSCTFTVNLMNYSKCVPSRCVCVCGVCNCGWIMIIYSKIRVYIRCLCKNLMSSTICTLLTHPDDDTPSHMQRKTKEKKQQPYDKYIPQQSHCMLKCFQILGAYLTTLSVCSCLLVVYIIDFVWILLLCGRYS